MVFLTCGRSSSESSPASRRGIAPSLLLLVALGIQTAFCAESLDRLKTAIDRGCRWIAERQNPDGGYGPFAEGRIKNSSDLGLTAFSLHALTKSPRGYKAADGPFISRAVDFILARQQADGSFYDPKDPTLITYKTSVVVMALSTLDPIKHSSAIRRAQDYLASQQLTEAKGYEESKHLGYGGIGYGDALRPNLSIDVFAAEALYMSGRSGSDELWRRIAVHVRRSVNGETVDPLLKELGIGTSKDGGARYAPNDTRGPIETLSDGTRIMSSYGTMGYAALRTLLYARIDKSDPVMQGLFAWASRNFTVKENPGMATKANPKAGQDGLYYYYHSMAKALAAFGEPIIKDSAGVEHNWARELSDQVVSLQSEDGSWSSKSERFWENIPVLDTSYSVIVLCECLEFLKKQEAVERPREPVVNPEKS